MPRITVVQNQHDIASHLQLKNKTASQDKACKVHWVDAKKFTSKNRIVNAQGITSPHSQNKADTQKNLYKIIEKKVLPFSFFTRLRRTLLGLLIVVPTLGIPLCYSKKVRKLFTKKGETLRFKLFENWLTKREIPEQKVLLSPQEGIAQEPIVISKEIEDRIRSFIQGICKERSPWWENLVMFSLEGIDPPLTFRLKKDADFNYLPYDNSMKAHYDNINRAKEIIAKEKLHLLVVPAAHLFSLSVGDQNYEILAQRQLDVVHSEGVQKSFFKVYGKSLEEAVRQLACFTCKAGYQGTHDMAAKTPVLHDSLDTEGNRRIAILGLEWLTNSFVRDALFGPGSPYVRGLISFLPFEMSPIVEEVAAKEKIVVENRLYKEAKDRRKREADEEKKLYEFHKTLGIVEGNEPIAVDLNSLDYSNYPSVATDLTAAEKRKNQEKLKKKAAEIVQLLNYEMQKTKFCENNSFREPIYARRSIFISTREDRNAATYLGWTLALLKKAGAIFNFEFYNGRGYLIQA